MLTTQLLFGFAAGLLEFVSGGIYIVSILKRHTKPDRVTWWILALVSAIITISYYATGARSTVWLPLAYTIIFLIIGILSIRYGYGPATLTLLDRICLIIALISILIGLFLNSSQITLYMNIGIDFIALVPTAYKAYTRPKTESATSWSVEVLASLFNVLAIQEWTFAICFYPIYLLAINSAITYGILRQKVNHL